jgi:hypothetical protein
LVKEEVIRYSLLCNSSTVGNISTAIEGHPNTLLLILTNEGHTIAVYSSLSYCETMNMKETKGLLISTNSRKSFPLKMGNNPIKKNK